MGAFLRLNHLTSQRIKRESTDGKEFIKVPADFPARRPIDLVSCNGGAAPSNTVICFWDGVAGPL